MKVFFLLMSLFLTTTTWARGPYNLPDRINCAISDPTRNGYFKQVVEISFPHIEVSVSQFNVKAKVEVSNLGDDQTYTFENVDLNLTFSKKQYEDYSIIELRTALAMLDGRPFFIISQAGGNSLFTPLSIDRKLIPLNSWGGGCLYLDGTASRNPGLTGSN